MCMKVYWHNFRFFSQEKRASKYKRMRNRNDLRMLLMAGAIYYIGQLNCLSD